jgi:hypothetical protein
VGLIRACEAFPKRFPQNLPASLSRLVCSTEFGGRSSRIISAAGDVACSWFIFVTAAARSAPSVMP